MLKVGIIAEGTTDQAVLINILKGALNVQREDIVLIRPELKFDKTDFANLRQLGGWESVKRDCEDGEAIRIFFESELVDEQRILIIQVDTAELQHTHDKTNTITYCQTLRDEVINTIKTWLSFSCERFYYAVCIEEMDAWILPLYQARDSVKSAKPKEKLCAVLKGKYREDDKCYKEISNDFRKLKNLQACYPHNESLHLFIESLQALPANE
ncbi:hypothetical protein BegalDRAFT_2796 [Beggiatoa alba B18LD]|uniref:DUF4276 family protein n=1 Tax=Beggiatoa alba B18LD TaxID=395493 RepID=I3CJ38_9GAMM|nr:hypothetical protein [Beggiatoa alba]EIJ43631.1 hypothetical protein BegalDRAFT_2796 [Beggiatoa alba B18LD]